MSEEGNFVFKENLENISDAIIIVQNLRLPYNEGQHYFQNDQKKIEKILRSWKLKETTKVLYRCGFDYQIRILDKNFSTIRKVKLCFNCKRLYDFENDKYYQIDEELIKRHFNDNFLSVQLKSYHFSTQKEGKEFLEKELKNPKLLYIEEDLPIWLKFEGYFLLTYPIGSIKDPSNSYETLDVESLQLNIQEKIIEKHPAENLNYGIMQVQEEEGNYEVLLKIDCNLSLYKKVNLPKEPWEPYDKFSLTLNYVPSEIELLEK